MAKLTFSKRYLIMPSVFLIFLFTLYLVYEDIKDRTVNEFTNEQLILARTASQGITSFFKDCQSDLGFLSELEDIIDFKPDGEPLMASFYENHKSLIAAITRVDSNGVILSTYPYDQSVIGGDISYQKHVRQIISTHKPVISDVFMAVQGYPAIALHIPVFKEKEYRGSLAILIPIDELGRLYLGNIEIRGTGSVCLLSENNIELYSPIKEHTGKPFLDYTQNNARTLELLDKIKKENSGTAKRISQQAIIDGKARFIEKYFAFYRAPLGNTYWTILISCQEKDIYNALTRLRNRLLLVFSLLLIAISYYFYSLAKVRNVLREEAKRKKAEKTLLESEKKFRNLFQNSPVGNSMISIDGFMNVNKSFCDILGYNEDELKSMKWSEITFPEDIPLTNEILKSLSDGKAKKARYEKRFIHSSGSIIWADVSTYLQRDKENRPQFFITAIIDITSRKQAAMDLFRAKEKAEESDRLKTAFLQNMSHEIRTPMNAIVGFSSLLHEAFDDKQKLQEYSDIINNSCDNLLELINDILDISRIESGQLPVNRGLCNLNELFSELSGYFEEYKIRIGKQHLSLYLNTPDNSSENVIIADSGKLRQILINLIGNAFKFTNSGKIEGSFRYDENRTIVFCISDTGIGIPYDKQDAIFERFTQLEMGANKQISGTGLGLSIVKGLVELLKGKIWLESEVGKGTVFYFSLPLEKDLSESSSQVSVDDNSRFSFSGKVILLVEDDTDNAIYLNTILSGSGLKVIHTASGAEAVNLALTESVDLVLMDIRLPGMNGYEALKMIKEKKPGLAIIAQTAYAANEDRQKAFDAGFTDYISKPMKRHSLLKVINKHLKRIKSI